MKILEKYDKKCKVILNGIIQWLTNEQLEFEIEKHNQKINKAIEQMNYYLKCKNWIMKNIKPIDQMWLLIEKIENKSIKQMKLEMEKIWNKQN